MFWVSWVLCRTEQGGFVWCVGVLKCFKRTGEGSAVAYPKVDVVRGNAAFERGPMVQVFCTLLTSTHLKLR